MKKICFVIPRTYYLFNPNIYDAEDKVGGAQKQAYLLSTSLAEDKTFDVHFLVADFGQSNFEEMQNIKIWKSFNFSDNILKKTIKLLQILKKIDAETYIFRSADIGVAFAIFFLKKLLKKKVLYMIASDVETTKNQQKKYSGFISALAMQFVYKKADIITAQTQQQASLFEQDRGRKPNSIIKNIYLKDKKKEINHKEKNTILWVGRLDKIKNPHIFINLAKRFPNEQFIMIAPIVRDFIEYGRNIHTEIKNIKNIELINYVKPTEIYKYYNKAKIYILTSDFEGFSNTMVEAMQSECAILSYNVNPDDILNKFRCGFCANKELKIFYKNFQILINNQELRILFGKNGKNYIETEHNKSIIIKTFKKLLKI